MRIKSQKDFFAGLMFLLVGLAFAWGAGSYSVGTGARMGPGYFPMVLGVLYTSGDLTSPSYDTCSGCYSPPVDVRVTLPTPIQVAKLAQVAFIFQDNDRNLNVPMGFNLTLTWE